MTEKQTMVLLRYERYLKTKGYESYLRYVWSVEDFFDYLAMINCEYDGVNIKMADDYRSYLVTEDNLARGTVNNKLNRVRNFYRFLVKKDYVFKNPFKTIKNIKTGFSLPKSILSVEDMGKLLDNFAIHRDYDLMLKSVAELLYGSGLRISEAARLCLEDIDFENCSFWITQSKNQGKRKKVLCNHHSLNVLKQYLKYTRPKLLNPIELKTGFIYPQINVASFALALNDKLKRECQRQGLKVITSHGFRHSVATHLLRSGAGIREVQAFLGHANITNTEIYTHVVKDDLKKVINQHHPRQLEVKDEV